MSAIDVSLIQDMLNFFFETQVLNFFFETHMSV